MGTTNYTLSLLLQAIDRASGPVKAVASSLTDLGAKLQQTAATTKQVGDEGVGSMNRFRSAVEAAKADMEGLNRAASRLASISVELAAAGASLAAAFFFPVKQAAEFEQVMANVKAVAEASSSEMARLKDTAQALGLTTKFTATQVAEGMVILGQAGLQTNQIITGLPAIINLASAGMLQLAEATDITVSIMYGMQMGVEDLARVTDVLSMAAVKTNADIKDIGEAMKYVAPAAAAAGVSLEQTAAMIGVLSNAGIKSTMAGTTLRGMLTQLADPTKEARTALGSLGVEIENSEGKMRDLSDILADLNKAHWTLGDAAKIFTTRAAAGALALSKNVEQVRELTRQEENAFGSTAKMAETMLNTVKGAWVNFMATIEAFSQAVAGPLLEGIKLVIQGLNQLLQGLTALVSSMGPVGPAVLLIIGVLGTLLTTFGLAGLALSGLIKLFGLFASASTLFTASGIAAATTTGSLASAWTALAGIGAGLVTALKAVAAALLTTVPGIVVTTIGLVVFGLYKWANASQEAARESDKLAESAKGTRDAFDGMLRAFEKTKYGSEQYRTALTDIIRAHPELASKIDLTSQSMEEHIAILREYQGVLKAAELKALGAAIGANAEALKKSSPTGDLGWFQTARNYIGAMKSLMTAPNKEGEDAVDTFTRKWRVAMDWFQAYNKLTQSSNITAYNEAVDAQTKRFKEFATAMGISMEDFVKLSRTQLEDLLNDPKLADFKNSLIVEGSSFDAFLSAAEVAQAKIKAGFKEVQEAAKLTDAEKTIRDAGKEIKKLALPEQEMTDQLLRLVEAMKEKFNSVPIGLRVAWKQEFEKLIKDFDQLGSKGPEAVAQLSAAIQGLNQNIDNLKTAGPVMKNMFGDFSGYTFKGAPDVSKLKSMYGEKIVDTVTGTINDACQRADIDPALVWAIIKGESGGSTGAVSPTGARGLGQFTRGTAKPYLEQMYGDRFKSEGFNLLFDPQVNANLIVAYLKDLRQKYGGSIYKMLYEYTGAASEINWGKFGSPEKYMEYRMKGIQATMAKLKGGAGFENQMSLFNLETEEKKAQSALQLLEKQRAAGLVGLEAYEQQKAAIEARISGVSQAKIQQEITKAAKEGNNERVLQLQQQLQAEAVMARTKQQELAIDSLAAHKKLSLEKQEQDAKDIEHRMKMEEAAQRAAASAAELTKAKLGVDYESRKISAIEYYSKIAELDSADYVRSKSALDKKLADEKAVWDVRRARLTEEQAGLSAQEKEKALRELNRQEAEAMLPITQQLTELETKRAVALANRGATAAKDRIGLGDQVVNAEIANLTGPVREHEASILSLKKQQNDEMLKFTDALAKQVQLNSESGGLYGMTQQEADAWQARLAAAQQIKMEETKFGAQALAWAETITNGFSDVVDSLLDGSGDIKTAMNGFFKGLFKQALEPGLKALTQFLMDSFKSLFGQLGEGLGNAILGVIGLIGMLLTSGGGEGSFSSSGATTGVSSSTAVRGVIAGETSINIAEISDSLDETMAPHLSVLRQIEQNTRGINRTDGGSSESGGSSSAKVALVVEGLRDSLKDYLDQYFSEYLLTMTSQG